jgi:hypothetical protein
LLTTHIALFISFFVLCTLCCQFLWIVHFLYFYNVRLFQVSNYPFKCLQKYFKSNLFVHLHKKGMILGTLEHPLKSLLC